MKSTPDEIFDNSSEEENYPELGAPTEAEAEAAANIEQDTDSTSDGDGGILGDDKPQIDASADPAFKDSTDDGDGDLFKNDD